MVLNKEIFLELGLTKNETEVYLTLLKSGAVSVNILSERTGLHRQAIYDALNRLLEKGFVSFYLNDSVKFFQASAPEQILDYIDTLKDGLTKNILDLKRMVNSDIENTSAEIYKGKRVIKIILNYIIKILKETKTNQVLIFGVEESNFLQYDKLAIEKYIKELNLNGFKEKLLAIEDTDVTFSGQQSQYRYLAKEYFNPNPIYVVGNTVIFLIFGTPLHAIVINNKEVADANRKQFEMLWKIAKSIKTKPK